MTCLIVLHLLLQIGWIKGMISPPATADTIADLSPSGPVMGWLQPLVSSGMEERKGKEEKLDPSYPVKQGKGFRFLSSFTVRTCVGGSSSFSQSGELPMRPCQVMVRELGLRGPADYRQHSWNSIWWEGSRPPQVVIQHGKLSTPTCKKCLVCLP